MVDGVIGGLGTCTGLSDLGRLQAGALRDRWAEGKEPAVDVVYASPLPRARETTDIVLPSLGSGELEVQTHDDLEEFRMGEANGLTWEQLRERYELGIAGHSDPYKSLVPEGDSRAGFRHRVAVALTEIAERHRGSTIFVGCHGGVISSAMAVAFGLPPNQQTVDLPTEVTSITEIEHLADADRGRRWRVRRYNDFVHIRGTQLDPRG
jgi:broad specificity phosphatase PhoE